MIDLQPAIREFILNDVEISSLLPTYSNSKTVFTRRPVPQDATYPMIIISNLVTDLENDYVNCGRRTLTFDISVYGQNDTATNYRNVERISMRLQTIFHRMQKYSLNMPTGSSLINTVALGPLSAPVDDETKIGRVVITNFEIHLEN